MRFVPYVCVLKEQLPGNDSLTQRFELPAEWKSTMDSWLKQSSSGSLFAPPPEEAHRFLLMLGDLLQSGETNAALVVDSPEARPYVRRLIEMPFPYLMVLSREELLPRDELAPTAA